MNPFARAVTWPLRPAADLAGRVVLAALDAVLESRYTDEALRRILASPVAERAIGYALEGSLPDAVARDVARHAVLERFTDEVVASQALERAIAAALESPETERLLQGVVDSPAMERLVARAVDSRLVDAVTEQLLESEELWLLVENIARSPAVTEAISHQSAGFADQVADEVRARSVRADASVERVARRLLRRRAAPPPPIEGTQSPTEDRREEAP